MTVGELVALLQRMPPEALICFRERLEDDGSYETVTVLFEGGEVVVDID